MDPQLRRFTDESEILTAIRDRMRQYCPGCQEPRHCFISDQAIPDDSIWPTGGHFVTIAVGAGTVDQSLYSGGGHHTLNEDLQVIVTPFVQMNLDRIPSGEQRLLHQHRGLSAWKKNILSVLLLNDPHNQADPRHWEPAIGQRPLLRTPLRYIRCTEAADSPHGLGWCGRHLMFSCSFDWQLGIPPS
ncbi:MAG: hypothetical protein KF752_11660 [Pirellulaceae bacterium]|nr:hypothetical protein [Pirellulaceae bacterium]